MPIERDQAACILDALVSLLRASRTVAHRDADRSVSATPIVLLRLVRTSEPRLGGLADQLRVKPSVASRTVAALESSGFVVRITDPDDARACRVQITDAGRQHLTERENDALHVLARTFDDWSPDDAELSVRILTRIEAAVMDWVTTLESTEPHLTGRHPAEHPDPTHPTGVFPSDQTSDGAADVGGNRTTRNASDSNPPIGR